MPPSKDYYELLGVRRDSSPHVIEAAYKALMRVYHPDLNRGGDTRDRAAELSAAYATLKDPAKRAKYDRALREERVGQRATALVNPGPRASEEPRFSPNEPELVPCPQCAELIRPQAKMCRFCGWRGAVPKPLPPRWGRAVDFIALGIVLTLVLLIVAVLVFGSLGATKSDQENMSSLTSAAGVEAANSDNGTQTSPSGASQDGASEDRTAVQDALTSKSWLTAEQCRRMSIVPQDGETVYTASGPVLVTFGDHGRMWQIRANGTCKIFDEDYQEEPPTRQVTLPMNGTTKQDEAIINRALSQLNQE